MTRPDRGPRDVLVAVPARNEAETLAACLASVLVALGRAQESGVVGRARIGVAAHRCTDRTVAVARHVLRHAMNPDRTDHLVLELLDPAPVGLVRTRLVQQAVARRPALDLTHTWVFSTDADSTVPVDWVTGLLAVADRTGAELVAGLTTLVGWDAGPDARAAYERLLAAGMESDRHRHVYAANLAVSYPAFWRAGGFPGVAHGEEHGLVAAVRAGGGAVAGALAPVVETSGRVPGRAEFGLGALLGRMAVESGASG